MGKRKTGAMLASLLSLVDSIICRCEERSGEYRSAGSRWCADCGGTVVDGLTGDSEDNGGDE